MDSIISAALSEICSQGVNGVSLKELWPRLDNSLSSSGLQLCDGVKRAIWNGVLKIPGLQFQVKNSSFGSQDPSIQPFEKAEEIGLKIVAAEHLRDCFVGLYDLKASEAGISAPQRRALERLAVAGANGITQSQLAKEFGMKGNNIFYVVRNLECQGLIVRQSTVVRTKEAGADGESASTSIVNTNLMHLYRYAKQLGSQQKLEITKADTLENLANADGSTSTGDAGERVKDDVLVKDYLPALKAVCDKLEEADGKVLVVSDIKQTLGYRRTPGHRAWRNVCNRLKDARLVEEFRAEVNKKVVNCLRLLKTFDPKHFQPKTCASGSDDFNTDQAVRCGTRGQITEQLLELPIEHQVYDMIASEGTKGITVTEVCKRLGLNSKKYYPRLLSMFSRFGLHLQSETLNRSVLYRVWTPGNFNTGSSTAISVKPADIVDDGNISAQNVTDMVLHEKSDPSVLQLDALAPEEDSTTPGKCESGRMTLELCESPLGYGENNQMNNCRRIPEDIVCDVGGADNDAALDLVRTTTDPNVVPSETTPPASLNPSKLRSYLQKSKLRSYLQTSKLRSCLQTSKLRSCLQYPCLTLTAASAQREQRILERLQEEKFVLVVELYRWLESLEKDKPTKTARKTLTRTLNKLQQEGHCKCVHVSVPAVTNSGRMRTTEVVLHKSILNLPPEFLGQIHERLRSFDMQSRGKGFARLKNEESVPVLSGITRTLNPVSLDCQSTRAEAMRVNGFVLAKMVRAKLLHNFLWGYINRSPDWNCALSSGRHGYDLKNPHSTCKLFALDLSIKAMPVELFLQVVGSTQKFADLVESCKRGLHLSDLPVTQYKSLMDTRATGRLSRIIDILCRLKLIRLVTDGYAEDADMIPRATLTHAMELKPYIEEPLSRVPRSLGVNFLDLRPRVRHDFILSNREAVDLYWKTLEYSYAQAESTSAVHAFPGSSVPEVYYFKSWSSSRVLTAEQRALLLKRVVTDDPDRKISFAECVKLAKDLNLTLEQVLRVSYDNRSSRLQRFQKDFNPSEPTSQSLKSKYRSTSHKRRKNSKTSSSKRIKAVIGESGTQQISTLSETDGQCTEENNLFTGHLEDETMHLQACEEAGYARTTKESGQNEENEEEEEDYDFISQCALSRLKTTRRSKFSWTESSERQLVIQYVRHRAALGAKFHRTDWGCLPDLPAPPSTCRRRMALLNNNPFVRRVVMKLCNLLGERYVNHLRKFQEKELLNLDNSGQIIQDSSVKEPAAMNLTSCPGKYLESDLQDQRWDDFDDRNIKMALDEVFRCNRVAKLETSRKAKSVNSNFNSEAFDSQEPDTRPSIATGKETQNNYGRRQRRSRCQPISEKFLKRLREGTSVSRRAYKSLAVANAVELLKLIFLNTSTAPEVPNLLAETLRRYSEHDLFAAFNYLREKKYMIGGNGNQFILSQKFLHSVSSSPFPSNTGRRAAKFARWLCEREKDLMEEGIHLNEDLQCGDIFYLLALVSTGEIFISPCLPDEGIGEAEEKRSTKHRTDEDESCSGEQIKKPIYFFMNDGEFISRRAKGFPGIKVSLSRITISRADAVELSKNEDIGTSSSLIDENDQTIFPALGITGSLSLTHHLKPPHNSASNAPISGVADESPWKTMTRYAECLMSSPSDEEQVGPLKPDFFKTVHSTIRKSGDQGLSIEEVSQVTEMQGKKTAELVIDVLQAFGLAVKVNAYDSVHIVDASFRSKYFLSSMEGRYQDLKPSQQMKSSNLSDNNDVTPLQEYPENAESNMDLGAVHKVTLLNLPEEVYQVPDVPQLPKDNARCEDYMPVEDVSIEGNRESEISRHVIPGDSHSFRPILPWINGDGTTNPIIYKGLTRRVLGIVMQSPGILEGDIFDRINVLNPQSCKKLLELMVLDNHLIVRKMYQTTSSGPPSLLGSLFGSGFKKPEQIFREHYFANQMSVSLL